MLQHLCSDNGKQCAVMCPSTSWNLRKSMIKFFGRHVYLYVYVYIYIYVCMSVCMYACMHMHACTYVCVYDANKYMCAYIYRYIGVCVCGFRKPHMNNYTYISMHTRLCKQALTCHFPLSYRIYCMWFRL